jgi:hypothetical protein
LRASDAKSSSLVGHPCGDEHHQWDIEFTNDPKGKMGFASKFADEVRSASKRRFTVRVHVAGKPAATPDESPESGHF